MKVLLLVLLAICAVSSKRSAEEEEKIFNDYLLKYNIRTSRSGSDYETKKKTFFKSLDRVDAHNKKFKNGKATYELEINEFSIVSHDEFVKMKTGILPPRSDETWGGEVASDINRRSRAVLPASWDWRNTAGVVRPVQSQGNCGSCWAFAAVGAIEGQMTRKYRNNAKLSEQEVIECARHPDTRALLGCTGGWDASTYNHSMNNWGITSLTNKPYRPTAMSACNTGFPRAANSRVLTFSRIQAGNANLIKDYLYNVGPLYVTYFVAEDFNSYRSGVYTDSRRECTTQYGNHGVLLVGYGTQNGVDYWLVKNSWGANWGEQGYFKIARGRNLCQIEQRASYPILP